MSDRCVFGEPFCADDGLCGFGNEIKKYQRYSSRLRAHSPAAGITYGGGSSALYGSYVEEQVCLGGQCGRVSLGMIRDQYLFQTNFNSTSTFYGILGLAYPFNACNPSCTTPIYEDIANQLGTPNVFGMCLTGANGGVMDMGYLRTNKQKCYKAYSCARYIDESKFTGSLQWVPVVNRRWYHL